MIPFGVILNSVNDGICTIDSQRNIVFWNTAAEKITGYENIELYGASYEQILHNGQALEGRHVHVFPAEQTLLDGETRSGEWTFRKKDGAPFSVMYRTSPVFQAKEIIGAVITFSDITDQKEANRKIQEIENLYSLISENTQDLICVLSMDQTIQFVSPSITSVLGYTQDEIIGKKTRDFVHRDDYDLLHEESFPNSQIVQRRVLHKQGHYVWIETSYNIIHDFSTNEVLVVSIGRDVTKRKQLEDLLLHAERIAQMGSFDWDMGTDQIQWSIELYRIFGIPSDRSVNLELFFHYIYPDDIEHVKREIAELIINGRNEFQYKIIRPDCTVRTLLSRGEVLLDPEGKPARMLGSVQDITERIRILEDLRESRERYQSLKEHNPDGICSLDLSGSFLGMNKAFEKLIGYQKEELIGLNFSRVIAISSLHELQTLFAQGFQDEVIEQEVLFQNRSGQTILVSLTSVPIVVNQVRIGFYWIAKNLEEKKRAEAELKKLHMQFASFVNENVYPISIIDEHGMIMQVNDALVQTFGFKARDLIGKSLVDSGLVPDSLREEAMQIHRTVFEGQTVKEYETVRMHQTGRTLQVALSFILLHEACGAPSSMACMIRDLTETKHKEELFRRSEKLSAVGQLAAGVAHEIRNPLTSLKGFVKLLRSNEQNIKTEYLDIMESEILRIEQIASEMLVLAKPQTLNMKQCDMNAILQSVITLLQTQAILKNIEIKELFEVLSIPFYCDENQMKQVFVNIIKNAIEAMPNGGTIEVHARIVEARIEIRVVDQGVGIPKEMIRRIGEPFYSTKEKGTGLGTMVSHKIIQTHHGTILYDSEESKGTTVTVTLPLNS